MNVICKHKCPKGMAHEGENICCAQCKESAECDADCNRSYLDCDCVVEVEIGEGV